jgi:hypothetical protein
MRSPAIDRDYRHTVYSLRTPPILCAELAKIPAAIYDLETAFVIPDRVGDESVSEIVSCCEEICKLQFLALLLAFLCRSVADSEVTKRVAESHGQESALREAVDISPLLYQEYQARSVFSPIALARWEHRLRATRHAGGF